nr:hypothetical protein [uncultured Kingella sp.]
MKFPCERVSGCRYGCEQGGKGSLKMENRPPVNHLKTRAQFAAYGLGIIACTGFSGCPSWQKSR